MLKVELHTHTVDDRVDHIPHTAFELIDRAAALSYQALAITLHDLQLDIRPLKPYAAERGIGRHRFEFQMLYGVRRETQEAMVRRGFNMRVYVPYGKQWFPYFYRRLRERKENVSFVLRNLVRR